MTSVLDRNAAESDHRTGRGTLFPGALDGAARADPSHLPRADPRRGNDRDERAFRASPDPGARGVVHGRPGLQHRQRGLLPSIRQALGFGGDSVQWVVTAYAITFGGCWCWAGA